MPYSDSLERPEISQPLKAINSTLSGGGGYSKGYDLQLKIHFYVYDIILFSNPLWEGKRIYPSHMRIWDCERYNTGS